MFSVKYVTREMFRIPSSMKLKEDVKSCRYAYVCYMSTSNEVTLNELFRSEKQKLNFAFKIPFVQ
jgi:hypothetical protein